MGYIFIKCDDATLICDKTQYNEASFWERMKLSFHLMTCKHCKLYTKQNAHMSKCLSYKSKEQSINCLSKTEKKAIKETVENSL